MRATSAAGWAGPWVWAEAVGVAGGQRASGRAGVARFCHLIYIITRVSLLDGGGKLITPVTVSPTPEILRCLSSSPPQA